MNWACGRALAFRQPSCVNLHRYKSQRPRLRPNHFSPTPRSALPMATVSFENPYLRTFFFPYCRCHPNSASPPRIDCKSKRLSLPGLGLLALELPAPRVPLSSNDCYIGRRLRPSLCSPTSLLIHCVCTPRGYRRGVADDQGKSTTSSLSSPEKPFPTDSFGTPLNYCVIRPQSTFFRGTMMTLLN